MRQKVQKNLMFESLGFPIILTNVPMVEIRGELAPDISYNKLQKAVLLHLCYKKTPLTGNEIKFIRKYFSLTTKDFGYIFGYTHSAVLRWENQENRIARMSPTAEFYLRVYVLEHIQNEKSSLKELYNTIHVPDLAEYLKNPKECTYSPLHIDIGKEALFAA